MSSRDIAEQANVKPVCGNHTVTLQLTETPTDILESELAKARDYARRIESQGSMDAVFHTWGHRADAIQSVLNARRKAGSR